MDKKQYVTFEVAKHFKEKEFEWDTDKVKEETMSDDINDIRNEVLEQLRSLKIYWERRLEKIKANVKDAEAELAKVDILIELFEKRNDGE